MARLQDNDGVDTALARLLHDEGLVEYPTLRACLDEVRSLRPVGPGATLAELLVRQGHASEALVEDALNRLAQDPMLLERSLTDEQAPGPSLPGVPVQSRGPYRLVRELARGGMGAVHEVVHEITGAHYALKTLHSALLSAVAIEELQRFRREAEVMAQFNHPHVGRIHSAHLDGPAPYLVQDLLTGGTLSQRVEKGPLDLELAVELGIKLARGLEHCHAAGVLHRDLKPQNVMFDERGEPRLVDFGLALTPEESQRLTESGTVMGTPSYMAPEQAKGRRDVDERVDVYGLGALLYFMLTGRPPFQGNSLYQILTRVMHDAPDPPRALRPEIPPALELACLRALAKDPQDRYPDVASFALALEHWSDVPTVRRGLPAWARLTAVAALLLSVLGLGSWLASPGHEPEAPLASAQPPPGDDPSPNPPAPDVPQISDVAPPWWRPGLLAIADEHEWCVGAFVGNDVAAVTDRGRVYLWTGNTRKRRVAEFSPGAFNVESTGGFVARRGESWISYAGGEAPVVVISPGHERTPLEATARARPALYESLLAVPISAPPTVALFDLATQRRLGTLSPFQEFPVVLAFAPDGSWLAVGSGSEHPELSVWDWDVSRTSFTKVASLSLEGHLGLDSIAIRPRGGQPDAEHIVTGGPFHRLGAYSFVRSEKSRLVPRREFRQHSESGESTIRGLAFVPTGDLLYAIASSRFLRFPDANSVSAWNPDSGERVGFLQRSVQLISLAISPDGEFLLLGTVKGGGLELVEAKQVRAGR